MIVGSPTKLNLIPSGVMPVVYINQGDAGYDKEFLIYNGDSPYNVPAGVSATIRGTKADGYGVTEAAALTEGSNLVTVTITEQMVAAAGENLYELVFVDTDGLRVASINMGWAVKKDALGDSVISDSDLDYATTVMNQLQSVQAFKHQLDTNTDGLAAETAARIAADNTLQNNINLEATTRASQDGTLQAQINQLIAPTGTAPSAAEVQNARIGADGITYDTLGDAIRGQVGNLENALNEDISSIADIKRNYYNYTDALVNKFISGNVGSAYGIHDATNYFAYLMPVQTYKTYVLRRTAFPWYEIDADGIILAQHGNSTVVNYLSVKATKPNTKFIAFSWDSVQPVNYMVLDPGVSFDTFISYPDDNTFNADIISNSKVITEDALDLSKANIIIDGFNVKQNFFNPSSAVLDKFCSGTVGSGLRDASANGYAYNVVPVEYGKTYIFSRSDYARFEFDENMICVARVGNNSGLRDFEYTPSRADVAYVAVSWYYTVVAVNSYMVTLLETDRSTVIPYPYTVYSNIPYEEKAIHIGTDKEYTSIMDAFEAFKDDASPKTFYIDGGVYDIYQELGGAAYLATITASSTVRDVCVFVPLNSKVVGLGSVTLNYLPPASEIPLDNAVSLVSPLNISGNAEIENITIICKNCRYAIHDETGTNRLYDNTKKVYRKVRAIKQANDYVPVSSVIGGQSFGCGFGSANDYLFEDCIFKSPITAFSMHNNPTIKNSQGTSVIVRNCVIDTDATQSMRFGAVRSDYAMENVITIENTYIKSRVTVTREAYENNSDNTFNLTLLNCSNIEVNDEFETHGWNSDYDVKVYNPIPSVT